MPCLFGGPSWLKFVYLGLDRGLGPHICRVGYLSTSQAQAPANGSPQCRWAYGWTGSAGSVWLQGGSALRTHQTNLAPRVTLVGRGLSSPRLTRDERRLLLCMYHDYYYFLNYFSLPSTVSFFISSAFGLNFAKSLVRLCRFLVELGNSLQQI